MCHNMVDQRHNSLYDRVNKLLVSYEWSDCSFSVNDRKFKAHKLILGISSPVFEAMFYGPLSTNDDILIIDVEPNIFQLLLNYIYTDKVNICSIEEAYDLLYVSRKYMVEYLSEVCKSYIQKNLNIDNVITILNYPEYMQDNELVVAALKLACQHAKYLLTEKKNQMSLLCIQKILESNEINMCEKDLIKCVFQWTLCYCDQHNINNDSATRREVLIQNNMLILLRFFKLTLSDLKDIIADENNLLLDTEINDIKQKIFEENVNKTGLGARSTIELKWFLCHRTPLRFETPITIEPQNNVINSSVKSNKSIFVKSLSVESRMAPALNICAISNNVYHEDFSISIASEFDDNIIKVMNFKKDVKYDSDIDIEFPEPILLEKDLWYKITFMWPKLTRFYSFSYAVQSRDRCFNNGKVKLEFQDISSYTDSGSFLRALRYCM